MKTFCLTPAGAPRSILVPDSAIVARNQPWFMPEDAGDTCDATVFAGAVISRLGMHIRREFARRYYSTLVQAVHPVTATPDPSFEWTRDGALITSAHFPVPDGDTPVDGCFADIHALAEALDTAIADISRYVTLKTGDLILLDTGIPALRLSLHQDIEISVIVGAPPVTLKIR